MSESSSSHKPSHEGGVKDTVEAILVAFILAFIFRAFVVEAFVIPTGSMAPTLYGAHMRLTCPDCGYTFDANFTLPNSGGSEDPEDASVPNDAPRPSYHCPNCGYTFGKEESQPVRFGDRILVLKYLYIFQQPTRWDVVVFKSPSEPGNDPTDAEFSRNYIKRLVGLPNESLVILDGDLYIGPPNATEDTPSSTDPAKGWAIQRKPNYAQDALWRTVFDNDYLPNANGRTPINRGSADPFREPWTADTGTGWDVGTPAVGKRSFHFSNLAGEGAIFFDASAQSNVHPLTDYMPYDEYAQANPQPTYPVSDLKLSAFYRLNQASAGGEMDMILTKDQDCFTAKLTPSGVELWQGEVANEQTFTVLGNHRVLGPVAVDWKSPGGSTQVDFANVDHRVSIRVGGVEKITHDYDPNVKRLFDEGLDNPNMQSTPPKVRISATGEECTLDHIVLSRDVYYLNGDGTLHGVPRHIAHLGPGEYFVLGDNSPNSFDARYWGPQAKLNWDGNVNLIRGEDLYVQSGRVPQRFMLGKAFFVYWPAGYRPANLPLGIVPDFGEMRFIH